MKRIGIALVLVIGIAAAALAVAGRYGVEIGPYELALGRDKKSLHDNMVGFLEAVQFKDFDTAANYHNDEDSAERDIAQLIESKFLVKPEQLNIMDFRIDRVWTTRSGDRGRCLTTSTVRKLNTEEVRDIEAMFYWAKENGEWYLKLESSL
ncbi:MAG: hypothetical protein PVH68_00990 [Armatimonadota bacterium]|jgi:hypothetical protein